MTDQEKIAVLKSKIAEQNAAISRLSQPRKTRLDPAELRAIAKGMENAMRGMHGIVARERIQLGALTLRVVAMELEEGR